MGEGGEIQAPLARVVIGGLLSSSVISLILVPVVYTLVETRRGRLSVVRGAEAGSPTQSA